MNILNIKKQLEESSFLITKGNLLAEKARQECTHSLKFEHVEGEFVFSICSICDKLLEQNKIEKPSEETNDKIVSLKGSKK